MDPGEEARGEVGREAPVRTPERALVTGATGCLGRHLVDSLVERGTSVRALARESSRTDHLEDLGVEIQRGSLVDEGDLERAVAGVDTVFHLGGLVRDDPNDTSDELWQQLHSVNVEGSERLARLAAAAGATRFVFASSLRVFGFGNQILWPEDGARTNGDLYARSKGLAEEALLAVGRDTGLEVVCIRPRFIYGNHDRYVLPRLVESVQRGVVPVASNETICDIVYVGDCVQALLLAAERPVGGRSYNITSGECLSFQEILRVVARPSALAAERPPLLDREGTRRARLPAAVPAARRPGRDRPPPVRLQRKDLMAGLTPVLRLYLRRRRSQGEGLLKRLTSAPERHQQETLLRIVGANAETTYGREHGFDRIGSIRDFQDAVPINSYEELRPYVERIVDGTDPRALTADRVEMFTNTSGTTSKPKLIPVTAGGRHAERRVKETWMAYLAADYPS